MQRLGKRRSHFTVVAFVLSAVVGAAVLGFASSGNARSAADSEIGVTMGKPREYSLKVSTSSAKAGEVALVVRNLGKVTHEFILLRTPTKAHKLKPRPDEPDKVVEPGFLVELEDVEPKHRVTLVLPLKKGHYVLLCNIEGHYNDGMRADLTLR